MKKNLKVEDQVFMLKLKLVEARIAAIIKKDIEVKENELATRNSVSLAPR
mgnify:CR=1 FL=1